VAKEDLDRKIVIDARREEKRGECCGGDAERREQGQEQNEVDDGGEAADEEIEEELHDQGRLVQVVLENAVESSKAVLDADLLALGVGAAAVRDPIS